MFCTNCGTQININDHFCPKCGKAINTLRSASQEITKTEIEEKNKYTVAEEIKSTTAERAGRGIFGSFISVLVGLFLIGLGIVLSLTGIGAICGLPLAIIGIIVALLSPVTGITTAFSDNPIKGFCPYCGASLIVPKGKSKVKCKDCQKVIVVRDMKLFRVD